MNIPFEVFDLLEKRLGREDALAVARSMEASLTHIEARSREIAAQRKLEVKEELKHELRDELATKEDITHVRAELKEDIANVRTELKEDIANLRAELKEDIANLRTELVRLDKKFTIYFLVTIFTVIFLNQNALEFLARLLRLVP